MKKTLVSGLVFLMVLLFSVPSFAYYISPKDIYGEPDRGYEDGYEDGFGDGGGSIIYKTREVAATEYIADHETRFRELYITFLLVLGICVAPVLIFRFLIYKDCFYDDISPVFVTVVYNLLASVLITYIMYRIDYLVPCMSIVILWCIICKAILSN